jgi:hypothetical protein
MFRVGSSGGSKAPPNLPPMIELFTHQKSAIGPQDLAMLERILNEVLRRRSIANDTDATSKIAANIIELFEHGIRNEQQFLAMLSGTKNFP